VIEQIGGWHGLFGLFLVPGVVAIPLGLTVADVVSKSSWSPGIGPPYLQLLTIALIWLLIFAWVAPDVFSRR
jgi:hypothetical protein